MTDLVIGAVTRYTYKDIEPWVVSLERSGFSGKKALIVYNMNRYTADKLVDKGFTLFGFNRDPHTLDFTYNESPKFNICVERFAHLWHFLNKIEDDITNVIATDVKDVIFQKNPSEFPWQGDIPIDVGSENILYENEPWSKNNFLMSFGPGLFPLVELCPIACAGVIAGQFNVLKDLFLNIFLLCRGCSPHIPGGGGPDQAALNLLLGTEPYLDRSTYNSSTGFILHAGTSLAAVRAGSGGVGQEYKDKIDEYKTKLLMKIDPELDPKTGMIKSTFGDYTIVHQYDRVPEWKEFVNRTYRDG